MEVSGAAVDLLDDAALQIHGPAFVQEHVLPAPVRYQVPAPAVTELVGNDVHILAVACRDLSASSAVTIQGQ